MIFILRNNKEHDPVDEGTKTGGIKRKYHQTKMIVIQHIHQQIKDLMLLEKVIIGLTPLMINLINLELLT